MAHVLIVDDEPSIRISLREFAIREGHRVDVAGDVDEALLAVEAHPPDIIVTDIILPRRGGFELLALSREKHPGIRVILITGEATAEAAAEAMKRGAFDFLPKPILRSDFLLSLQRAQEAISS